MSNLKLSLAIGELSLQLEGEGELVQKMLNELRENGLGELYKVPLKKTVTPAIQSDASAIENAEVYSDVSDNKYPPIKELIMKNLVKSESEWLLLYAFYSSNFGVKAVSRDQIKEMYKITEHINDSRSKNFSNNLSSVVSGNYISMVNDDEYIVSTEGRNKISEILSRKSLKESKTKVRKTSKIRQFQLVKDLDLSPAGSRKGLKDFVNEKNRLAI